MSAAVSDSHRRDGTIGKRLQVAAIAAMVGMMAAGASLAQSGTATIDQRSARSATLGLERGPIASQVAVFIENKGQWDRGARFLLQTEGMETWVTNDGVVYDLFRVSGGDPGEKHTARLASGSRTQRRAGHVVRVSFEGAGGPTRVHGTEKVPGVNNYFLGNDPAHWATDVTRYSRVKVNGLYDGIDAVFYVDGERPRYDLVIAPGGDPTHVRMHVDGADGIAVTRDGALSISTTMGAIEQRELFAYQEIGGRRREVRCAFAKNSDGTVGFSLGAYDRTRELVIDPLVYSTFIGGRSSANWAKDIAVDANGNTYICGYAQTNRYPTTTGAYDVSYNGGDDGFVTKFNSGGTAQVYSTYLGGSLDDNIWSLEIDANGNVYTVGSSEGSTNYPTTAGAFDRTANGFRDIVATKLNASGNALIYSTYLGGNQGEWSGAMKIDGNGNMVIVGMTEIWDASAGALVYPTTPGAYATAFNGGGDGVLTILNANGSALVYSTLFGGTNNDQFRGVALDRDGDIYMCGFSRSTDFPTTPGALSGANSGDYDATIVKFTSTGTLVYSTLLGGTGADRCYAGIAVDADENAYVTGYSSSVFPTTTGAYDESVNGSGDIFVSKIAAGGGSLSFSTYIGTSTLDEGSALALDAAGNIVVFGTSRGSGYPTTSGAVDATLRGYEDFVVSVLNTAGSSLLYSTFLGGNGNDMPGGMVIGSNGDVYLCGSTNATDYPATSGVYDASNSSHDGLISVLRLSSVTVDEPNGGEAWCVGSSAVISWLSLGVTNVSIELSSNGGATWPTTITSSTSASTGSYTWSIPDAQATGTNYRIRVKSTADGTIADESNASFSINGPPAFTQQPADLSVCLGGTVTLAAQAVGAPVPTLQWQSSADGTEFADVVGATSPTLVIAPVTQYVDGMYYRVIATSTCGTTTSSGARITLSTTDNEAPIPDLATLPTITGSCSATIASAPTASDNCMGAVTGTTGDPLTYTAQGTYTVTWTYFDGTNSTTQAQTVVVDDNTPPTITVSVSPSSLTPVDRRMQTIAATVTTNDDCAGVSYVLTSITSSEPESGTGAGDLPDDIQNESIGTADLSFDLRAESKRKGNGRTYTIRYTATDIGLNSVAGTASVYVAKMAKPVVDQALTFAVLGLRCIPNPLREGARIEFSLANESLVRVRIHDARGALAAELLNGTAAPGTHGVIWDARDRDGKLLPTGPYFVTVEADGVSETSTMMLVR